MKKCLICQSSPAVFHPTYGWLPCQRCSLNPLILQRSPEFTTDDIKAQRKEFRDDIIQPFNKGYVSKEYLEKYGNNGIKVSEKEIKNAKKVWGADRYYQD